ncbi:MAG: ECF-type sigma factor [Phycisphaerae bacterium]
MDAVLPLMYKELRALAAAYMRQERPNHTLQPTALINEAYLRICDRESIDWSDRGSFFAAAAQMMRRLLVDHARHRGRHKRGGGQKRVPLEDVLALTGLQWQDRLDIICLDESLTRLAQVNEEHARIVELRFFAGLSVPETASAMCISVSSVERGWRTARAWLYRELEKGTRGISDGVSDAR